MNQIELRSVLASYLDQLSYTYQNGSNKHANVSDAAAANSDMLSHGNKGVSSIQYNYLNLTQTITMIGKGVISLNYYA